MGFDSARAFDNASSRHGYQSTGLWACWSRYGLVSPARRFVWRGWSGGSALGNLPELFISLFALQAGLATVVQTALIGSILANSLLVLGLAFLLGGLRNGVQTFQAAPVRSMAILLVLAVAALAIPTLATQPGAPDAGHRVEVSVFVSLVLLVVFAASIPYSISGGPGASPIASPVERPWPLP